MSVKICPRCQKRIVVGFDCNDFIHECNSGKKVLDEEDVVIVGKWSDYTGSGDSGNVNIIGVENKLWGTRAEVEGANIENKTVHGKRSSTHRQRQHLEFMEFKKDGEEC
jgi:hypothetical protein